MHKLITLPLIGLFLVCTSACRKRTNDDGTPRQPLIALRAALKTTISAPTERFAAPDPPPDIFEKVSYRAPLGQNVAYVSPVKAGAKRPAIVWIAGGFDWAINEGAWEPSARSNNQSARAFREAGIVLMRPSLRGSNENPGHNECFLGEVDDVLAAADYLSKRADVDPQRVYLGGHSTGGTMVLLVAASTLRFRAVFSFGPVADPRQYGADGCLPAQVSEAEALPRAPVNFLRGIRTPTLIIEGRGGNMDVFNDLTMAKGDAPIKLQSVPGADHFNVLAPATEALAARILADTGPTSRIELDVGAVAKRVAPPETAR